MFSYMVFAVFDSKVGAFLLPFFCRNRAVALRSLSRLLEVLLGVCLVAMRRWIF